MEIEQERMDGRIDGREGSYDGREGRELGWMEGS